MLGALVARPFVAVFEFLIALAEANPTARQLQTLSETSDAALATRGLTRQGEIARIMGGSYM
ncbi:MAG: hypothetical protein IBX59_00555 [Yoonia sp.]|nr:hypothetical protein [Yoonia sp.]